MIEIEIWYTDDLTAEYGLTERVPQYKLVHSYEDAIDERSSWMAVCDDAYTRFNRGSGREDPALDLKKMRSLSMGDIVKAKYPDGTVTAHVCASSGWRPVESWERADA